MAVASERGRGLACPIETGPGCCAGAKIPRSILVAYLVAAAIALTMYLVVPIWLEARRDGAQTSTKEKPTTSAITGNDANFESEVLRSDVPVLVDFWASWCGPCKTMGPIVDALADEYRGKLKVVKVRIEDAPQAVAKYGVESVPTFLVIQRGEVRTQLVGAHPKEALVDAFKPYLN